ncbi:hypothetical protein [Candidatus Albibeggiatoa sp. nov. BB20]|uniref:hypothetical protein n=1 Tax=Candidatus Albibeggiatoa sp. nov. BB20 TaxID=3162723 RepID=UPI003365A222
MTSDHQIYVLADKPKTSKTTKAKATLNSCDFYVSIKDLNIAKEYLSFKPCNLLIIDDVLSRHELDFKQLANLAKSIIVVYTISKTESTDNHKYSDLCPFHDYHKQTAIAA